MTTMTPRQRLLGALAGKPVDRVPISTYEMCAYGEPDFYKVEPSYARLMKRIGEQTDCVCMWEPRAHRPSLVEIEKEIVPLADGREERYRMKIAGRTLTRRERFMDGLNTVWHTEHWCKEPEDADALMSLPHVPATYDFSGYPHEMGEGGIVMQSLSDPAYALMANMEFGAGLVWVMTETEHFASLVEKMHLRTMDNLERMLTAGVVDLYRICGPEYMTPPYLPPEYFARFMTPYITEMTQLIHARGGRVRLHCHGKIGRILSEIEKMGVDALDPCEEPPDGDIALSEVKRRVGDKLCLFGSLELKLLEGGTPESVRAAVRKCMDSAKAGGRYVIMPTAAPINAPLSPKTEALYEAFIDEARAIGAY